MTKNFDAEQKAEELLMALGQELGRSRGEFGTALMDESKTDPPMLLEDFDWEEDYANVYRWELEDVFGEDELEEKLEEEIKDSLKKSFKKRRVCRSFILTATLILVMGLMLVVAEGVKVKESTLYTEETEKSTRIIDQSKAIYDPADFYVSYVPEGYELVEDTVASGLVRLLGYSSNSGDDLRIHVTKTDQYGADVDNERGDMEPVHVNDKEAYLFRRNDTQFVVWQIGDCTVDVSGSLPREELLSVAASIYVK